MVSVSDISQVPPLDLLIDAMCWVVVSCIFIEETELAADDLPREWDSDSRFHVHSVEFIE
jgi:hypothetical protein